MDRITQDAKFRQQAVEASFKLGIVKAAERFGVTRKSVRKWRRIYDGTRESLFEKSRRPHHSPRVQTHGELKPVKRLSEKYSDDLLPAYEKACKYGYHRSYGCFKKTARKFLDSKASKALFEQVLADMGIAYHRIRIATPRRHRIDELRFYKHMKMYGLADGRKQPARYQRESNKHIMTCLKMRSPNDVLMEYPAVM